MAAITAKWTGWLAQVDPRKQPSVKKMVGAAPKKTRMSGKEIGAVMRALARKGG